MPHVDEYGRPLDEFGQLIAVPKPKGLGNGTIAVIVLLAILAMAAGGYAFRQHRELKDLQQSSSATIEAHLQIIALRNQQVEALDSLASRIDQFNHDFDGKVGRIQLDNLEGSIGAARKEHLPEDAQKTLDAFEATAAEVARMGEKVKEFEHYLGSPLTVKRGQSHAQLAELYLVNEAHLTPEKAKEVVRQTALDFDVEPGNEVFNLYHDGMLLTTVTQGTAKRPPMLVQLQRRRAARNKTKDSEEQVEELTAKVKELETKLGTQPVAPDMTTTAVAKPGVAPAKAPAGTFTLERAAPK